MKPKFHTSRFRNQTLGASLVTVLFVSFSGVSHATTWVGDTSNNWGDNLNWSGDAGTGGSNAVVNTATTTPPYPVISATIPATPVDIFVGINSGSNGRLDHTAGTAQTGGGNWMDVGVNGGTGVYNLANTSASGGTLTGFGTGAGTMNVSGRLYVGGSQGGGRDGAGGNGTVNVNTSGNLAINGDLNVGIRNSVGVVRIDAGTVTTNGWNFFGRESGIAGGNGSLSMSGGSLTNTNGNARAYVGLGNAVGSLSMSGGTYNNIGTSNDNQFAIGVNNLANATTSTMTMTGGTVNARRLFTIGGTEGFGGNGGDTGPGKGSMTINGSGALLNVTGEFWVGQGTASVGNLNLQSGTIQCNSWIAIGRGAGSGTVTMTGGTIIKTGAGSQFIVGAGGPGTMTQSAGLVDVQGGYTWVGEGSGATTASYTISGTAELRSPLISVGPESPSATLNLDGGTVRTRRFMGTRDENGGAQSGTGTINFNGSQIIATADNTAFISSTVDNANIGTGGLLVNSNGFTLTAPKALAGTGGVVKSGTGKLSLLGFNTYSGNNTINAGELVLGSGGSGTGDITVADGAALGVSGALSVADQLISTNVTFGTTAAGTTLNVDEGNVAGSNPSNSILSVTGNLALPGNVVVNTAGSQFAVGIMPLVSYVAANRTGTGVFTPGTLPNGVVASLVDDPDYYGAGQGLVYLDVSSVALPEWDGTNEVVLNKFANTTDTSADIVVNDLTGIVVGQVVRGAGIPSGAVVNSINIPTLTVTLDLPATATALGEPVDFVVTAGTNEGLWDINTTANWEDQVTLLESVYKESNPVLFSDNASGPTAVTLNSTVNPTEVLFNNSIKSYSLSGTGAINGTTGLTKQGTAALNIGTLNTYDGVTKLEGGITTISTIKNGGVASSIGDSSAAPANLVLAGGILEYTGAAESIDRGFTLTAAGSGIRSANNLTFSGQIASTGGDFRKQGAGNLSVIHGGTNTFGNGGKVIYVEAGTLTFDGTAGGQVNNVLGEMWVGSVLDVPANLTVTNTTLNLNSWLAVGPGNGDAGVTNVNISNSTVQTGGFSTGYNNGQANNASESFVNVTGSTWTNNGQVHIAESANSTAIVSLTNTAWIADSNNVDMSTGAGTTSTLNITGTSEMKVNRFLMALGTGSVANVVIEDSGKLNKTGGSWMSIGNSQTGVATMTIRDSGSLINSGGDFNIGDIDTSNGTLNLESNASVTSGGAVFIGKNGTTGTVNMSGASTMTTTSNTNIAGGTGSNGTLNIGGTAAYSSTGRIHVGPDAGSTGTLLVEGSGVCGTNSYISIGYNGGGSMTVKDSATFNGGNDFSVNESGDVATSLTLQGTATINVTGSTFVGRNTGRIGTVTHTGGTFNGNGNEFQIGRSGSGTWLQSGGTVNVAGWPAIGRLAGGTGVLTVSAGSFNQTATDRGIVVGEEGTGTINIQGTGTVSSAGSAGVIVSNSVSGVGTINLDGGTLEARKVIHGGGNSTFHFNGGVLKAASGADLNFLGGLTSVDVKPGGAFIDSNGQTIAISQSLGDADGGLTKQGSGTLLLNGSNGYLGTTTVSVGTLGGTGLIGGELVVSTGASIAPGASGVGTFSVDDTLGNGSSIDGTYVCEISGSTADKLTVGGSLDISGATLDFDVLSAPASSVFIIAEYASLAGTFTEVDVPSGFTVDYNYLGGNKIALVADATPYGTWASSFGLDPLGDGAPGADKDGDGQNNGIEFALGGDPTSGSNNAKIYNLAADSDADGNSNKELILTIAVRTGTPAFTGTPSPGATQDGFTCTVQGSADLSTFTAAVTPVSPVTAGLPTAPTGYEYRSFSLDGSDGMPDKGFLRVQVTY